jgi:hypothetical protein
MMRILIHRNFNMALTQTSGVGGQWVITVQLFTTVHKRRSAYCVHSSSVAGAALLRYVRLSPTAKPAVYKRPEVTADIHSNSAPS